MASGSLRAAQGLIFLSPKVLLKQPAKETPAVVAKGENADAASPPQLPAGKRHPPETRRKAATEGTGTTVAPLGSGTR